MITIPIEQAIAKITEKAGISEEDINNKIDAKLEQLSGLISREGAAYIIANELGVKLFEQTSGKLQIKNILTGMRDIETVGKVTKKFDVREFNSNGREGKVGSFIMADETASVRIVCWGLKADEMQQFNEQDIVMIKSGYVRENNNQKEVHMNDKSTIIINPEGVTINNIAENYKDESTRKHINELNETSNNVELFGTIVQSFEPRFFEVCPNCNKRARPTEDKFVCAEHGNVNPDYSYVMNAVLDDGTETIRCVFFRNQAEKLINKSREDMLNFRSKPEEFETVKNDILGNQIKVTGRSTKNSMFDRLEFMVNDVNINPDPKKEIEKIEKEL